MAKKGDYTIKPFYQGSSSELEPSYGDYFTGYRSPAGNLGANTKPDTANQIQQVNMLLNQGIVPIELTPLKPEVFDQIPKQHFKEMNRMAKLNKAKLSLHSPIVEPSGIGEQGWSETSRELAERQLIDVAKKSFDLDDKERVPITIHSSGGIPGSEIEMTKEGKKTQKMVVINQETGKMTPLEEERLHYPKMQKIKEGGKEKLRELEKKYLQGKIPEQEFKKQQSEYIEEIPVKKGKLTTPSNRLVSINHTEWDNSINQLFFNKERADEILNNNYQQISHLLESYEKGKLTQEDLTPAQKNAYNSYINAKTYLEDTRQQLDSLFNKAYKYSDEEEQKELIKLSEKFKKELEKDSSITGQSQALNNLMHKLSEFNPQIYVPVEKFALDKSSETFANVAWNTYQEAKKKKKQPPIISIENMYPGMGFAQENEEVPGMSKLIEESRQKFINKATKEGMSKSQAKKEAEKMIGMTLDLGHLNIAKKHGFKDEDLKKEVEQVAKNIKHVHITDNFGYSDSHLPPGMGNVPTKEILEELEKQGVKDFRQIVEAGGWVQNFGTSPLNSTLEGMGSSLYETDAAPYWNQSPSFYQGYSDFSGMWLPQGNYQTFGAGFSQLPTELGGQVAGGQGGRMSGRPME